MDAADPLAANYTSANGWSWGDLGEELQQGCPQVTPVPCAVPRCKVDTPAGASVECVPAPAAAVAAASAGTTAAAAGTQQTRLLFANSGFELWARRTSVNGRMRNAAVTKTPPASWWGGAG